MQNIRPKSPSGRYIETVTHGETVRAFVPFPLPPEPAVNILSLLSRLSAAQHALGRLDAITVLLPQPELFLYMYVRKEAILSSQIEGTQSSLSDLLRFETDINYGEPFDDIREVCNYVDAIMYGLERLKTLPLSLRLLREVHEPLLRDGRGLRRHQESSGAARTGLVGLAQAMPCLFHPRSLNLINAWTYSNGSFTKLNPACRS